MAYTKGNLITAADYNGMAGLTGSAAASAAVATAKAGYLWGVGYGDRGYGQSVPALTAVDPGDAIDNLEWINLRSVMSSLATWQGTAATLLPTTSSLAAGATVRAELTANTGDDFPALLNTLDTNRLNYQVANMTATASAATTTRSTTWGAASGAITADFSVTFASEDAARYFFNTGGEVRVTASHPNTSTPQDTAWNTILNGFVASFRANSTARTGGSYGTAQAIGYYQLTTTFQTIINGTGVFTTPYASNSFVVQARAVTITGANGAKGSVLQFRITLTDGHTNTFYDTVQSGTVATVGHLRATGGGISIAAPTCAVVTAF